MQFKTMCTIKFCIISTIGVGLVIFGIVFAAKWQGIFDDAVAEEMKLKPNSRVFESWREPPIPLAFDIYLFNWTNPEDFTNHSTKPILQELGPYRFTEKPEKVDITWNPENFTITYRRKSVYYFDAAGSVGSLDDVVTTLNMVAVSSSAKAKTYNYFKQKAVSFTLRNHQVHITKTAAELLFDGYEDAIVTLALDTAQFLPADEIPPYDRVGFFYGRNNTANGTAYYNVDTGIDDIKKLGIIRAFNYQNQTEFFADDCGVVNGSAGEFYPQQLTHQSTLSLFTPDLCRSIPFDFSEEVEIHGIKAYKYSGGEKAVDNGTLFPETACYSPGEKLPVGVFNISACRYGAPVFMSFPHFYKGDQFYVDQVEGLSPNKSKHEFFYAMEPKMGVPLNVAARLQLNIRVEPNENIGLFQEVPTVLMPVMWFEQYVLLDKDIAYEIAFGLRVPTMGFVCCGIIIFIGILLIICIPLHTMMRACRSPPPLKPHKSAGKVENGRRNGNSAPSRYHEGSPFLTQKNGDNKTIEMMVVNGKADSGYM